MRNKGRAMAKWRTLIALICFVVLASCASDNLQLHCGDCCVKAITAAFDVRGQVRTGWYGCGTQLHSQAVRRGNAILSISPRKGQLKPRAIPCAGLLRSPWKRT